MAATRGDGYVYLTCSPEREPRSEGMTTTTYLLTTTTTTCTGVLASTATITVLHATPLLGAVQLLLVEDT